MNVTDKNENLIVEEIKFVLKKMDEDPALDQKLYYFSGIQAIFQRIFNIEYHPDLVHVFSILQGTYNAFMQRKAAIDRGDRTVPLMNEQMIALYNYTGELLLKIEQDEVLDEVLKKFLILSYSTTGNGYYLFQKGLLKLKH